MIDLSNVKFEEGIDCYVFDGYSHQGEKWVLIDMVRMTRLDALYKIFELMMDSKTVMLIRREEGGVLYSANTKGYDREGLPFASKKED